MLDSNPFKHIVGNNFPCAAEPPLRDKDCPCIGGALGGPQTTDDGVQYCPACLVTVGLEPGDDMELFDEDDDEEAAFAEGIIFVPEGERIQNRTREEDLMIKRLDKIHSLASALEISDNKTAVFLVNNDYHIAQTLRNLELSKEPLFKINDAIAPKILAIVSFQNRPISTNVLRSVNVNPTAVAACLRSLRIIIPGAKEGNPITEAIRYIGNATDTPKPIVDKIIEQYEENPLMNIESNNTVRGAAFVYLKLRQAGYPVTKAKMKNIPGVEKNALDRAIRSYEDQMRNGNNRVEAEDTL